MGLSATKVMPTIKVINRLIFIPHVQSRVAWQPLRVRGILRCYLSIIRTPSFETCDASGSAWKKALFLLAAVARGHGQIKLLSCRLVERDQQIIGTDFSSGNDSIVQGLGRKLGQCFRIGPNRFRVGPGRSATPSGFRALAAATTFSDLLTSLISPRSATLCSTTNSDEFKQLRYSRDGR